MWLVGECLRNVISILWWRKKVEAGSDCCTLLLKTTEEDRVTASLAAANEISLVPFFSCNKAEWREAMSVRHPLCSANWYQSRSRAKEADADSKVCEIAEF